MADWLVGWFCSFIQCRSLVTLNLFGVMDTSYILSKAVGTQQKNKHINKIV